MGPGEGMWFGFYLSEGAGEFLNILEVNSYAGVSYRFVIGTAISVIRKTIKAKFIVM